MDYQSFLEGLFICGEDVVPSVVSEEKLTLIVDVRAEAKNSAGSGKETWINVPLDSAKSNQAILLKEAIEQLVQAYQKGERAVLH
ncbi:hypothetical protein [Ammoniphilus sp. CFH 90114]|uniref:hypothetical protein n=1 Tax=Ammoniphilus sp. CFH 90114 TaxID=2493665 RepID=UPI00100E95EC|nr:hypothetical protein [Ammoniphilus sp. CFH 90114]RXT08012.1 hypothetical protein EIZ39_11400 [Ammoniphilus sp. CFH 90114]